MNENLDTLAKRVFYIIKTKNLSDAGLGRIAGVTGPSITAIREGKTDNSSMKVISNICENQRINLDWLIWGKGPIYWNEVSRNQFNAQHVIFDGVNKLDAISETTSNYIRSVITAMGDLLDHIDTRLQNLEKMKDKTEKHSA